MDDLSISFTSKSGEQVDFSTTATDPDKIAVVEKITKKLGTGHESATIKLARDPSERFDDLELLQQVEITAADGTQIFKGAVTAIPPESNRLTINASGNFSILKDNPCCSELYADMSSERWGAIPPERRAAILAAGYTPIDGTTSGAALQTTLSSPPWTSPGLPAAEFIYQAPPGVLIDRIAGTWTRENTASIGAGGTPHRWVAALGADAAFAALDVSTDLEGAGPSQFALSATGDRQFAMLAYYYDAAFAVADSVARTIAWTSVIVVGDHGIASLTPDAIIKHALGKWCPGITWDSDSITAHPFVFQHLVAEKTTVADIVATCNSVANWDFGVRGDQFYFRPAPLLTDADFVLSLDDGDTLSPSGASMSEDRPVNQAKVYYTDALTGRDEVVSGDDDYRLRVDDIDHACNVEGRNRYLKVEISGPCDQDQAIQIGSVALAEQQVPSRTGSATAVGTVTAADGSKVPVSHIQEGDVVRFAHESIGRQVQSLTYQPALSQIDLEFDDRAATLSAMLARIGIALTVAGGR